MKINVDRMATLAGLGKASKNNKLNESMQYEEDMNSEIADTILRRDNDDDLDQVDDNESMEEMYHDDMDELIEIDEIELVQELRRAKKMMIESKRINHKQKLQEQNLKKIIEEEVQNIFGELELNLNADWIYGKNKPTRSKKGHTAQGSFLKGVGFK